MKNLIIIKKFVLRSFNNIYIEYGMSGIESLGVVCKVIYLVFVFIELIIFKYILFLVKLIFLFIRYVIIC